MAVLETVAFPLGYSPMLYLCFSIFDARIAFIRIRPFAALLASVTVSFGPCEYNKAIFALKCTRKAKRLIKPCTTISALCIYADHLKRDVYGFDLHFVYPTYTGVSCDSSDAAFSFSSRAVLFSLNLFWHAVISLA